MRWAVNPGTGVLMMRGKLEEIEIHRQKNACVKTEVEVGIMCP